MFAYAAIPLTCWLCALLVMPRKPRFGDVMQELAYSHLPGRHQRVLLFALITSIVTFSTFIIRLPGGMPAEVANIPDTPPFVGSVICNSGPTGQGMCWIERPGGMWAVEKERADGSVLFEDYVSGPPPVMGQTLWP